MSRPLRVALYSPADLNVIDGSAIWVQAVAETLHVGPEVEVTVPLRVPVRRDVITRLLRRLERVRVIEPAEAAGGRADGLTHEAALDLIEALDAADHFDVVLLRSFALCRLAARRRSLRGRLWSAYVLEPERDVRSMAYRADLAAIAEASRHVLLQSEEMRALFETLVPEAADRLALLPPAIPDEPSARAPGGITPRLIYTGKFHPFYPVAELAETFGRLRRERPELSFHVAGDKIHRLPADPAYAPSIERLLMGTPGLVWHGGMARDDVEALLAEGGVALSVWARDQGPWMNDLVISTKLLDYCSVGLPVVLNRTAAQEGLLGLDYPLFVERVEEVEGLLRRALGDEPLYREAAERCWQASRPYTYRAVHARLAPYLAATVDRGARAAVDVASLDRPKLPGSVFVLGLVLDAETPPSALEESLGVLEDLHAADDRFRLLVRDETGRASPAGLGERLRDSITLEPPAEALSSWLRRVGFLLVPGQRFQAARASGSVPLHHAAGSPGGSPAGSPGSLGSVAEEVRALVESGRWAAESERARARARTETAGVRAVPG